MKKQKADIKRTRKDNPAERVGEYVSIFKRGAWWHARYTRNNQQQRQALKTKSERIARREALKLDQVLAEGENPRPKPAPTVDEAVETYTKFLKSEGRSAKTITKYIFVLNLLADLCRRRNIHRLSDLSIATLDAYRAERAEAGRAKRTIYTESIIVKQLVKHAYTRGEIRQNPLRDRRLPKPKLNRQPFWSPRQMNQIEAAVDGVVRDCFILLRETGMRIGELCHLTWDDVDEQFIHIRAKDDWRPKTGDERAVPTSPRARGVLQRRPHHGPWVVTMPPTSKYPQRDRMIVDRWLLVRLKRTLKELGLKGKLHSFRHSFISHALTSGVPEAVVRNWVGHVDPQVMKIYTHVADEISTSMMRRLAGEKQPAEDQHEKDAGGA